MDNKDNPLFSNTPKQYRLLDLWPYDTRTDDWPIIRHGVWTITLILFFWLLLVHVLLPRYMRNRPPMELRVWMLVLNSIQLTSFTGGLPVALYFNLNSGSSFLTCKPSGQPTSELYIECLLYIGYLYIWWKTADGYRSIISVLRKREDQRSLAMDLFRVNEILGIYFGFRIQPIGMSMFYPTLDALVNIYVNLCCVLSGGGSFYTHTRHMKRAIPYLRLLQAVLTLGHVYVIDPNHCDYPSVLLYFELEISIVMFFASIYHISNQWRSKKQHPDAFKKQH